jgi:SpoIID/LytB domain protein
VITGKGYGHGVGLSQYGARGRALAGQDAPTILAHYFRGTTIGTLSASTQVRVLVLSGFRATIANPLRIYGRGAAWSIDGIAKTFPADAIVRVWRDVEGTTGVWKLRVSSATGAQLHLARFDGPLVIRAATSSTKLQLYSKPSANDTYRGVLRIHTGSTATVVNQLPLEHYLRGVVPMEMPSSWPAEALAAQAIAARSYAAKRLHPTSGTYDVFDDTRSQVYAGTKAERSATNLAISATSGQVLTYGTSVVNAFFHSTGGGATEHNENAWVSPTGNRVAGPIAYLRGSADVDPATGKAYDAASPWASWTTSSFTPARLTAILAGDPRTDVGTVVSVTITHKGVSGRVVRMAIVGSSGAKYVSGEVFRQVVNAALPSGAVPIRSTSFQLKATG